MELSIPEPVKLHRVAQRAIVKVDAVLGTASSIILPPVAAGSTAEPIQLVIEVGDKIYAGSLTPALDGSQEL